jgi:D-amino-acid dehydrogenase
MPGRSAAAAGLRRFAAGGILGPPNAGGRAVANSKRRVGVIGGGIVGVCAASWLQRDGHSVFLVEAAEPGRGASFGNAGCFNGSSVTPVAMPGVMRNVPR